MGQSVRTKNSTTILPADDLNGSTVLPSKFSAKALCIVCGTRSGAPNPEHKNITQIIPSTGICERYMAAGILPTVQLTPILHASRAPELLHGITYITESTSGNQCQDIAPMPAQTLPLR